MANVTWLDSCFWAPGPSIGGGRCARGTTCPHWSTGARGSRPRTKAIYQGLNFKAIARVVYSADPTGTYTAIRSLCREFKEKLPYCKIEDLYIPYSILHICFMHVMGSAASLDRRCCLHHGCCPVFAIFARVVVCLQDCSSTLLSVPW